LKLYLDTSALVKLYVEEEGSATVREALRALRPSRQPSLPMWKHARRLLAGAVRDDYREATTAVQSRTFNLTGTILCFLKSQ
jgi:predicted nucleic acid-binding protein